MVVTYVVYYIQCMTLLLCIQIGTCHFVTVPACARKFSITCMLSRRMPAAMFCCTCRTTGLADDMYSLSVHDTMYVPWCEAVSASVPHTVGLHYIATNYEYFLVLLWYLITFERLHKCLKIGHDDIVACRPAGRPGYSIAHASFIAITMQVKN
jgi:hypothetical protein